ncbi:MAG: protein kinase domain-containing protein, partial [Blastocatellia bacterium]
YEQDNMIGQTLSHYRILEKLGAGGMGEVYLAEDDRLGRKLALKVLPEQFMQDAERVKRFEQEARAASALNHPNIITIYDIGHAGNLHYLATEFIEGETLRSRMDARRLTVDEAMEIALQTAAALQAAHNAGIAHRDIKPENIMLRPDGYVKVLDFGLAKLTEQTSSDAQDLEAPTRSLFETHPGLVIGTVAYMSPEQARGQRVDGRTDIFSLGIVLYEMISGQRPFGGLTVSDMIASLLTAAPARLSEHLPAAPIELEQIINRMLAKNRDERFQTAQEVIAALKRVKSRREPGADPGETRPFDSPPELFVAPASLHPEDTPPATRYETRGSQPPASHTSYETNIIRVAQAEAPTAAAAPVPIRAQSRRRWLLPALIVLALAVTGAFVALQRMRGEARIDSIAVLPFVNESNDPEADYLSEGIMEGVINSLSQWPELGVSARNSVIRYRGQEADAGAVGRELDVKAVLLGRIARRGKDLTINAELVNARNGRQIWGERFTRKITDLIAVQEEIARKVGDKLQLRLNDEAAKNLAASMPGNAEAYDLYLKGRYFWNKGTVEDKHKADEYFEAAFAKDSSYALAAAGCAACHAAGADREPPAKSMTKAKMVALIALKKNGKLADPHLTLADVNLRYDWNFDDAEREFKRAIELEPKNAMAHLRHAEFLALMGRRKEALNELNVARRLDPQSLPVNQAFGTLAYYSNNYRDAVKHLRDTLLLDDDFAPAHTGLGLAYEQQGQTQDAVLEFMRARMLSRENPENVTALKKAYAEQGREAFWREYLSQLQKESKAHYIPSSAIAAVHVRLGQHDHAFQSLNKALVEKDGGLVELKVEPVFDPLRPNTKFHELLRRVGLAQ